MTLEEISVRSDSTSGIPADPTSSLVEEVMHLRNEIAEIKEELNSMKLTMLPMLSEILRTCSKESEACCESAKPVLTIDPSLFVSILTLARDNIISARTANALDCAGVRYVSDFQYITLNDLSSLKGLNDKELGSLLEMLEDKFGVYVTNSKRICPQFHVHDVVRFLPATSSSLECNQSLIITAVDYSPILPKYTCTTRDKNAYNYSLSPSVLEEFTT